VNYIDLSQDEQIALVSQLVPLLMAQYPVDFEKFENINHGFNSSFKVTTKSGEHFALRINTNSKKNASEVTGEVLLLEYINQQAIVLAPKPLRTLDGSAFAKTHVDFLGREVFAVLCEWIDGEELDVDPIDGEFFELGANMAKLHKGLANCPEDITKLLPRINRTLFNSPDNLRKDDERLELDIRKLIDQTFKKSDAVFERLAASNQLLPIHADLHVHNVLRTPKGLAVIDFDDVGIGYEIQDLTVTNFYLRYEEGRDNLVLAGYESIKPLPKYKAEQFEAIMASRQLLLLNDLLDANTAEEIAFIPEYIEITKLRLDNYLRNGRFELIKRLS
jgi:Ser/Thr protein kinase RdoA (MazF antagonist)